MQGPKARDPELEAVMWLGTVVMATKVQADYWALGCPLPMPSHKL